MFELSLMCPEDRIEAVSDALDALDALSVSVEDADAQTDAEQALFGEPGMPPPSEGWQRSRVVALFATEAGAQDAQGALTVPARADAVSGVRQPVEVHGARGQGQRPDRQGRRDRGGHRRGLTEPTHCSDEQAEGQGRDRCQRHCPRADATRGGRE